MTRVQFTKNKCTLITEMIAAGEEVFEDYLKRSTEEQQRLFNVGLSKCDGVYKVSMHQVGKAVDLYFIDSTDPTKLGPPKLGYEHWHKRWEELGGDPMIVWDKGHFEA